MVKESPPSLMLKGFVAPLKLLPRLLTSPALLGLYATQSTRFLLIFFASSFTLTGLYGGLFILLLCPLLAPVGLSAAVAALPTIPVIIIMGYYLRSPLSVVAGFLTSLAAGEERERGEEQNEDER